MEVLAAAGARLLAVESGQTVILDPDDVVARADAEGIVLLGVSSEQLPGISA